VALAHVATAASAEELDGDLDDGASASDPTASVNFADLRFRYFDLPSSKLRRDYSFEGAVVPASWLKVTWELHYWDTNLAGHSESSFESFRTKGIFFLPGFSLGKVQARPVVGMEWIKDLGRFTDGTGAGADSIAPLAGIGWNLTPNTFLVTLVQYFNSYSTESAAPDVEQTGPRLILIQKIPQLRGWLRLDDKFSIDHEDDNSTTNLFELQVGTMLNPRVGVYLDWLYRTGGGKPYNWGAGVGLRVMF
jgi:hypothetical protein